MILALDLQHPYDEYVPPSIFALAAKQFSAKQINDSIRYAAYDDRVFGIIANISQRTPWSLAQIEELSAAIAEFRSTGKPVIAWADSVGQAGNSGLLNYTLACTFDEIVCQHSSDIPLSGLWLEQTFLRGLLDKLEIQPQIYQKKEYKNAANQIMEYSLTDAHRENVYGLGNGLFNQIVTKISHARNKSPDEVKAIIRAGVHDVDSALHLGLIDKIMYEHELPDYVKRKALVAQSRIIAAAIRSLKQKADQQNNGDSNVSASDKGDNTEITNKLQENENKVSKMLMSSDDTDAATKKVVDSLLRDIHTVRFSSYVLDLLIQKRKAEKFVANVPGVSKIALIYANG
jgi:ClpP class serine protease